MRCILEDEVPGSLFDIPTSTSANSHLPHTYLLREPFLSIRYVPETVENIREKPKMTYLCSHGVYNLMEKTNINQNTLNKM